MSANSVRLEGRLTGDVDTRKGASGNPWAKFSIAVPRAKPRDGEPDVHYFDCTTFGKAAETLGAFGKRGRAVLVSGELVQERWNDKDTGAARQAVRVVAWRVTQLEGDPLGPLVTVPDSFDPDEAPF